MEDRRKNLSQVRNLQTKRAPRGANSTTQNYTAHNTIVSAMIESASGRPPDAPHEHQNAGMSSYEVFIKHYNKGGPAAVVGTACYREWIDTRKEAPKRPEESFRRSITAHLCKSSGRRPFNSDVEADILRFIRRKEAWPMAKDLNLNIGSNGFRAKGYHELQAEIATTGTNPAANPKPKPKTTSKKKKKLDDDPSTLSATSSPSFTAKKPKLAMPITIPNPPPATAAADMPGGKRSVSLGQTPAVSSQPVKSPSTLPNTATRGRVGPAGRSTPGKRAPIGHKGAKGAILRGDAKGLEPPGMSSQPSGSSATPRRGAHAGMSSGKTAGANSDAILYSANDLESNNGQNADLNERSISDSGQTSSTPWDDAAALIEECPEISDMIRMKRPRPLAEASAHSSSANSLSAVESGHGGPSRYMQRRGSSSYGGKDGKGAGYSGKGSLFALDGKGAGYDASGGKGAGYESLFPPNSKGAGYDSSGKGASYESNGKGAGYESLFPPGGKGAAFDSGKGAGYDPLFGGKGAGFEPFSIGSKGTGYDSGKGAGYDSLGKGAIYDSNGKGAIYESSGKGALYEAGGKNAPYDSTGKGASYDSLGKGALYDSTGKGAIYESTGKGALYEAGGKGAVYDSSGKGAIYESTGKGAMYESLGKGAAYESSGKGSVYGGKGSMYDSTGKGASYDSVGKQVTFDPGSKGASYDSLGSGGKGASYDSGGKLGGGYFYGGKDVTFDVELSSAFDASGKQGGYYSGKGSGYDPLDASNGGKGAAYDLDPPSASNASTSGGKGASSSTSSPSSYHSSGRMARYTTRGKGALYPNLKDEVAKSRRAAAASAGKEPGYQWNADNNGNTPNAPGVAQSNNGSSSSVNGGDFSATGNPSSNKLITPKDKNGASESNSDVAANAPFGPKHWMPTWRRSSRLISEVLALVGLNEEALANPKTQLMRFLVDLFDSTPPQVIENYRNAGLDMFSASGLYMLNGALEQEYMMETLKRSFLCPINQEEIQFDQSSKANKIARLRFDLKTMTYLEADETSREIAGGNVVHQQATKVHPSKMHIALTIGWALPALMRRGYVWSHMRFDDLGSGKRKVIRVYWKSRGDGLGIVDSFWQDVTHLFPYFVVDEKPSIF